MRDRYRPGQILADHLLESARPESARPALRRGLARLVPLAALLVPLAGCGDSSTAPDLGEGGDGGEPPPPELFSHTLNPGASARAFLADEEFTALVVEIDVVGALQPGQEALDSLQVFLERRLNKPGGISIVLDESIPSPGLSPYSVAEVRALEEEHRDTFTEGSTLAAYFLFLDGSFETENVLGIAYFNTSMAIFEEVIRNNSGAIGEPRTEVIEATVMRHEIGHILGLVNNGTPMLGAQGGPDDHHDEAHGAHCTVEGSLMYFQVETTNFIVNLTSGGGVPELEPLDIADLRANGGR
ncbi:MAG: hypothetical protein RQ745_11645 [Longimicrobiales bacterium]|nr:hypothetical protein [Longimicrobiales bacterium]